MSETIYAVDLYQLSIWVRCILPRDLLDMLLDLHEGFKFIFVLCWNLNLVWTKLIKKLSFPNNSPENSFWVIFKFQLLLSAWYSASKLFITIMQNVKFFERCFLSILCCACFIYIVLEADKYFEIFMQVKVSFKNLISVKRKWKFLLISFLLNFSENSAEFLWSRQRWNTFRNTHWNIYFIFCFGIFV